MISYYHIGFGRNHHMGFFWKAKTHRPRRPSGVMSQERASTTASRRNRHDRLGGSKINMAEHTNRPKPRLIWVNPRLS
jgi:hypothetical protein